MTPPEMTAKEKQELSAGQEKTRPGPALSTGR
jgi:hypothetical protein